MIPRVVESRLQAHVASILRTAHVPAGDRDELAEELFGHLVERWQGLVGDGLEPMAAADEAIRGFGSAGRIGADLTRAFRGRMWASTIGALLPAQPVAARPPRIAWWLSASLLLYGAFYAFWSTAIASSLSPIRAVLVIGFAISAVMLMAVAAMALARRQRWALDLAIVVNVIGLASGAYQMLTTPGLISLNVFFSGLLLLFAATSAAQLDGWVRGSRTIPTARAFAILLVALGAALLPAAAAELPDPTQAGADDLHVSATLDCEPDLITVAVDVRWDRTSLLPGGLGNVGDYGDLLLIEVAPEPWLDVREWPALVDRSSGRTVAEPGIVPAIHADAIESAAVATHAIPIRWDALRPGHTYRATWWLDPSRLDEGEVGPTVIGVEYHHAEAFGWETIVRCDGGMDEPFISPAP